jgi:Ca2+-binding RTX toxin-like protein
MNVRAPEFVALPRWHPVPRQRQGCPPDSSLFAQAWVAGVNVLDGSDGDDLMLGGAGNDTMTGWTGSDRFWLQNSQGADSISDFTSGTDHLRITGREFGIGSTLDANELGNRSFAHLAIGSGADFVYRQNTDQIWFDSGGFGGVAAILIATLSSGPASLSQSDFQVI